MCGPTSGASVSDQAPLSRTYQRKLDAIAKAEAGRTPATARAVARSNAQAASWRSGLPSPRARGVVLYEGESWLESNGRQVVVVATGLAQASENTKTGDMVATYIMDADTHPLEAVRTGKDRSVCGDCRHRPHLGGGCYVEVAWAVAAVWRAWKAGRYPAHQGELRGASVRLGSYGDPAAVPIDVWTDVTAQARTWAGYTHLWKLVDPAVWAPWFMASVDTDSEEQEAQAAGWRTFRVLEPGHVPLAGARPCPATTIGLTCAACGGCNGTSSGAKRPGYHLAKHGTRKGRAGGQAVLFQELQGRAP